MNSTMKMATQISIAKVGSTPRAISAGTDTALVPKI